MIGLNRQLAPLSQRAWKRVEREAKEVLTLHLAGRRIFDFKGPLGWEHSAIDLGRLGALESDVPALRVRRRLVRPLVELRLTFGLDRQELERIDRGASTVDLDPLREAARTFAWAEDQLLFEGNAEADIPGLLTSATQKPVVLPTDPLRLPEAIAQATEQLRLAGVGGPYAAALGPPAHAALHGASGDGGYPIMRHVERLLDRPVVFAPSLAGGAAVSLRGGDFTLVCGRDAAIGYESHDDESVTLFLEESLSVEVNGPEAVVPLRPPNV